MPSSEDILGLTQSLIRCRSITPSDAGCQEILAERLRLLGFHVETLIFGDVTNLWARLGTEPPLFVFAGHTDVVPPGPLDSWSHDPFAAVVDDGRLFGRGAADMKSSLAAFIAALETYLGEDRAVDGSIGLLITSDEEGPAVNGTCQVIDTLVERNETIDYCIVGEPSSTDRTGDTIKNGRRGSLSGVLRVKGVQGHVAYPHLAVNPVSCLAPALDELERTQWGRDDEHFPATTFQITSVQAGTEGATNVIPELLILEFNFRFGTEHTADRLKERFTAILEKHNVPHDIDWTLSGLPFLTPDGALVAAARQAVEQVVGIKPILSTAGGTSDGRFIAPTGAEVVELGPVNKTIHKIDENIEIADLEILSKIYRELLARLLG